MSHTQPVISTLDHRNSVYFSLSYFQKNDILQNSASVFVTLLKTGALMLMKRKM